MLVLHTEADPRLEKELSLGSSPSLKPSCASQTKRSAPTGRIPGLSLPLPRTCPTQAAVIAASLPPFTSSIAPRKEHFPTIMLTFIQNDPISTIPPFKIFVPIYRDSSSPSVTLFSFFGFQFRLALTSLCSPDWPQNQCNRSASASRGLGSQACVATPGSHPLQDPK